MQTNAPTQRTSPRVLLQQPIPAELGQAPCIVVELGLGGAKIEHESRAPIGERFPLQLCGRSLTIEVRYSVALPGERGIVYHSGVSFEDLSDEDHVAIHKVLVEEAQSQVIAWEANLDGRISGAHPRRVQSSVAPRFVWMRLTGDGWKRVDTTDPNQPIDGFAVPAEVTEDEIKTLCQSYEMSDESTREALRRIAMLAVLERLGRSS